jgi:hypothetical protein
MSFEADYEDLVIFAQMAIYERKLRLDPSDLVNDAYLKFIESGKPYLKVDILRIIKSGMWQEFSHERAHISEEWQNRGNKITSSYCNPYSYKHP